jgi:hypothetical protein
VYSVTLNGLRDAACAVPKPASALSICASFVVSAVVCACTVLT